MSLQIRLYGEIESGAAFISAQDGQAAVQCSADAFRKIIDATEEQEIVVDIHSPGGSTHEGFAIYDILRRSGKTIHTNIEGSCHSMAVAVLLAAPLENRSANPNARSIIHLPRTYVNDAFTAEEFDNLRHLTQVEEEGIVRLYVERTRLDERQVRDLLAQERVHTAQELLELGFIGKINPYTTNSKTIPTMTKTQAPKGFASWFARWTKNVDAAVMPANFDYLDQNGDLMFSTASEEDKLAVGDEVTLPNGETAGTFVLTDGRTVVIEDGKVKEITEPDTTEVENLRKDLEAANAKIEELSGLLTEARNYITSNYVPDNRAPGVKPKATRTVAAVKPVDKDSLKTAHESGFPKGGGVVASKQ